MLLNGNPEDDWVKLVGSTLLDGEADEDCREAVDNVLPDGNTEEDWLTVVGDMLLDDGDDEDLTVLAGALLDCNTVEDEGIIAEDEIDTSMLLEATDEEDGTETVEEVEDLLLDATADEDGTAAVEEDFVDEDCVETVEVEVVALLVEVDTDDEEGELVAGEFEDFELDDEVDDRAELEEDAAALDEILLVFRLDDVLVTILLLLLTWALEELVGVMRVCVVYGRVTVETGMVVVTTAVVDLTQILRKYVAHWVVVFLEVES